MFSIQDLTTQRNNVVDQVVTVKSTASRDQRLIRRLKPMTKYTSLSYVCKRVRFSKANDVKTASYNQLNQKKGRER